MKEKAVCVYAVKRSGHHAIINWLAMQHKQSIVHFNDCIGWERGTLFPKEGFSMYYEYIPDNDRYVCHPRTTGDADTHIFSFENIDLKDVVKYKFESILNGYNEIIHIIVIRDPFNWAASCMRDRGSIGRNFTNWIPLWKQHALEVFRPSPVNIINYNLWVKNKNFRENLAMRFAGNFNDNGIDDVPFYGGGSSFDAMRHCGRASKMDVLNRWMEYIDDHRYISIFDDEMIDLSEKIFGMNPIKKHSK